MTREEIHTQCLDLPEAELAELAEKLASSLGDLEQLHALREALEKQQLETMREKLEAEMATWFTGEFFEMTDARWDVLMQEARSNERLDEPFGTEVPPEWTGKTRREFRQHLKRTRS